VPQIHLVWVRALLDKKIHYGLEEYDK